MYFSYILDFLCVGCVDIFNDWNLGKFLNICNFLIILWCLNKSCKLNIFGHNCLQWNMDNSLRKFFFQNDIGNIDLLLEIFVCHLNNFGGFLNSLCFSGNFWFLFGNGNCVWHYNFFNFLLHNFCSVFNCLLNWCVLCCFNNLIHFNFLVEWFRSPDVFLHFRREFFNFILYIFMVFYSCVNRVCCH